MDQEPDSPRRGPGSFTSVFMALVPAGLLLFFLNLVTLGVFFWVMVSVFGLVLLGLFQYVLWGQAMSEETAGEREEQRIKEEMHIDQRD